MASDKTIVRITPGGGLGGLRLHELWEYRDLLRFLVWRDVMVRYKQAALGIAWALLQPLVTMLVFTVIFGGLAKMPSDGVPYPLFTFAALLPWQLFASAVSRGSSSLVSNANLVSKVYFPRVIIPLGAVAAGLVDFLVALGIMFGLMIYYRFLPTAAVLWIIPLTLYTVLFATAVSLWLSALNVRYRDVQVVVPFLIQIWMFVSPVAYSAGVIGPRWRTIYALNPMAGIIQGFRSALLGTPAPGGALWVSLAVTLLLTFSGLYVFRRLERSFADII